MRLTGRFALQTTPSTATERRRYKDRVDMGAHPYGRVAAQKGVFLRNEPNGFAA
jgi:hypothetical protein